MTNGNSIRMVLLRLVLLVLMLSLGAVAQTPDDDPFASGTPQASPSPALTASPAASPGGSPKTTFKVEEQTISVVDRYGRPFLVPENTAWLGVRLATGTEQHCKALQQFKEISAGGQDYPNNEGAEYSRFSLNEGAATVHFVVFSDAGKNPLDYELMLFVGEGENAQQTALGSWSVGQGTLADQAQATDLLAPHTRDEKLAMYSFLGVSLILLYVLFGRSLFARFLRNKKMEVSGALGWSNILIVLGALVLAACFLGMWLWPTMLWNKTWSIYAVVIGSYLGLMALTYVGGLVVTRK